MTTSYIHQPFGYAPRGPSLHSDISDKRYARQSFIAAKCGQKIMAPFCFQGTCNTSLFNLWIKDFLIPALELEQVVVMDKSGFHKSDETRRLIGSPRCKLLFLSPYSPDLNPIERFWAHLKATIRSIIHRFGTLQEAIDDCFQFVYF